MPMIHFERDASPESADSMLSVNVSGSPRQVSSQLCWPIVVGGDDTVTLASGGDFSTFGGTLFVCVEEPRVVRSGIHTEVLANGYIDCSTANKCYQIELWVSQVAFDQVRDLAMRGIFPSAFLTFNEGCGIQYGGSPDGDDKDWDDVHHRHVPIAEFSLRYTVPSVQPVP